MAKRERRRSGQIAPGLEALAVPVRGLKADPENARTHPVENIDAIKRSLKEFGQQKPIVVGPGGRVIAGNGTLEAARELGWKRIAAVRTDLEGLRQRAYAIADNRTAELAKWDTSGLAGQIKLLEEDPGVDATATGFSAKEIAKLLADFDTSLEAEGEAAEGQKITCPKCGHVFAWRRL